MRRLLSVLIAVVAVGFTSHALAGPRISLKGVIAVKAASSAAKAIAREKSAVPLPDEENGVGSPALSPALDAPAAQAAPVVQVSASAAAEQFRARCDAAKGVIVGVVTQGFCVIN